MAEYILDVVNQTSKLDWAFPFQRTGSFPLDRSALFSSLADATAYALGDGSDERALGGTSYVGQIISVYEEDVVNAYLITAERSLMKLAATTASGDFAADIAALQGELDALALRVKANEEAIAALKPIVEEHTTNITNLTEQVEESATNITNLAETIEEHTTNITNLTEAVENVENAVTNVYTKEEIDNKIASVDHLKRKTVVSVESIDLSAADAEQYIYMIANDRGSYDEYMVLEGALEKVGDWHVDLSEYAKTADVNAALDLKADKTDLESLAVKSEVEEALALKADKTDLESLAVKSEVEEALAEKADTSYVDEELAKKVDADAFNEALALKADKASTLAGYGITDAYTKAETYTRQEIADLIADITGGESAADVLAALNSYKGTNDARVEALEVIGAQANVIEVIKANGVELAIADKVVDIPAATAAAYGLVKLSEEVNVNADGALEVTSLNVNKLVQTDGEWLILNGGSSAV